MRVNIHRFVFFILLSVVVLQKNIYSKVRVSNDLTFSRIHVLSASTRPSIYLLGFVHLFIFLVAEGVLGCSCLLDPLLTVTVIVPFSSSGLNWEYNYLFALEAYISFSCAEGL